MNSKISRQVRPPDKAQEIQEKTKKAIPTLVTKKLSSHLVQIQQQKELQTLNTKRQKLTNQVGQPQISAHPTKSASNLPQVLIKKHSIQKDVQSGKAIK